MRLIDAETFLEALENADADVCETYSDFYCDWGFSRKAIEDLLLNIPTIDAEPVKHGKWEKSKHKKDYWGFDSDGDFSCYSDYPVLCTVCKYDLTENNAAKTPFCPNCGADMRERKET